MIAEELVQFAKPMCGKLTLADICIGVGYTGVELSDGRGGVCYTFRRDLGDTCGVMPGAGGLSGMPAAQALDWTLKDNLAQAAVGVSVMNALLGSRFVRGENVITAVGCTSEETVGMVGDFCPLKGKFRRTAKQLYIFERDPVSPEYLPESAEEKLLPACDVVILSSTTVVTKKIDRILSWCTGAREIVLVGATTPMAPEVWKKHGVTALAGTGITDARSALRILSQGGGAMDLSPVSCKLFERV